MESCMVNQEYIKIISDFFSKNLPQFVQVYSKNTMPYGPFFCVVYNYDIISIEICGECGLYIDILIDNTKYGLWQYDKSVNKYTSITKSNIELQLCVLKSFLDDIL